MDLTGQHVPVPAVWQLGGLILPTIALVAVFVRLGGLLKTVQDLEKDVRGLKDSLVSISSLVVELKTWRELQKSHEEDYMQRIRRIEEHLFIK